MNKDLFGGITEGLMLDSSLSDSLDKSLSPDEYKGRIISYLEPLLRQRFPNNPGKQKIRTHIDRITISCPYCGDSMQSDHKKRGNIILKGKFAGYYKCHNCFIFKDVNSFLKDYRIDPELDLINYLSESKSDFKRSSYGGYDISILMDVQTIEKYAIDRQEIKKKFNFVEVAETPVLSWLKRRLQYDENRFLYNIGENYLAILNLTTEGKVLGFQRRNFEKRTEKYMTYNLRKIYQLMNNEEEIPEEVDILSLLYKITEVNFNRPVTLFEGAFDAFLFPNSVANTGAGKGFPFDMPLRYFFDKDQTGIKKSIEKIENEEEVFLWDKFLRDFSVPYRKKWDLNDILLWGRENNVKFSSFESYFSNDPLDAIDI